VICRWVNPCLPHQNESTILQTVRAVKEIGKVLEKQAVRA
jgi:hypothetical protein